MSARRSTLALVLAVGACLAATALTAPGPASAAEGVLTGPRGLSLTTAPTDLSAVRAGDRVHMVFTGLDKTQYVDFVGNCPSPLPAPVADLTTGSQLANLCLAKLDTGLQGAVDAATGENLAVSRQLNGLYPAADGSVTLDYLVGSGSSLGTYAYIINYADGRPQVTVKSLSCGATAPCTIGFAVRSTRSGFPTVEWLDLEHLVVRPQPLDGDTSGCAAADDATITAAGPERGQVLLSALNRSSCSAKPGALPVDYVPTGEPGVSGVGTDTDLALAGSGLLASPDAPVPTADRLLVPLALSAAVLAEIGGPAKAASLYPGHSAYSSDPLPPLSLEAADVARIVLHDYPVVQTPVSLHPGDNTLGDDLKSRPGNAAVLDGFDPSLFGLPLNYAPTVTYPTGQSSTAATLSGFLAAAAPTAWRYPALEPNVTAARAGAAVGTTSSFNPLVDPGAVNDPKGTPRLTSAVATVGSIYSAIFGKDIATSQAYDCPSVSIPGQAVPLALSEGCVRFVAADSATASSLRLPAAKVQNTSGAYVAPTTAALQAAATGAVADGNGVLTLPATDPAAYPMTVVEYAVVPAAPLLTKDCLPRTAQQERLRSFLTYATGAGQAALPAGTAPLTPALAQVARDALARLGTGKVTGACATPTPTATASPTAGAGTTPTGGGAGLPFTPTVPTGTVLPGGAPAPLTPLALAAASAAAAQAPVPVAVPRFTARPAAASTARPLAGLVLLVVALSSAGLLSAGRTPPLPLLVGAVQRLDPRRHRRRRPAVQP